MPLNNLINRGTLASKNEKYRFIRFVGVNLYSQLTEESRKLEAVKIIAVVNSPTVDVKKIPG